LAAVQQLGQALVELLLLVVVLRGEGVDLLAAL
jgi:hypothetical protein